MNNDILHRVDRILVVVDLKFLKLDVAPQSVMIGLCALVRDSSKTDCHGAEKLRVLVAEQCQRYIRILCSLCIFRRIAVRAFFRRTAFAEVFLLQTAVLGRIGLLVAFGF